MPKQKIKEGQRKNKKQLRKIADVLWFHKLLKPQCEVCNKPSQFVHHFYYKSSFSHLRYELDNGISLCKSCHFLLHTKDPKIIESKIIEKRGQKWLKKLTKKAFQKPKPSFQTEKWYNEQIKQLQNYANGNL